VESGYHFLTSQARFQIQARHLAVVFEQLLRNRRGKPPWRRQVRFQNLQAIL